jgi:hypothetical protein
MYTILYRFKTVLRDRPLLYLVVLKIVLEKFASQMRNNYSFLDDSDNYFVNQGVFNSSEYNYWVSSCVTNKDKIMFFFFLKIPSIIFFD